jgi:transcriptional regulator with XRE-family HTH domain
MTANQIVATNLRRARLARDWTLEETTARLEPHIGERWTVPTLSSAEGSRHGKRIRKFDADQLAAFAECFGVPVGFFFQPPEPEASTSFGVWKEQSPREDIREEDVAAVLRQTVELLERLSSEKR